MRIRTTLFLLCALPATMLAQGRGTSDAAKARAALAPFTKLLGQWEGDARVSLVPGAPPQVAKQRYEITSEAGGTIIRVKGVGRSADGTAKGPGIFEANASIWFDPQQNRLRMKARQAQGDSIEATIEVRKDTLIWGFPFQAGRVRFTIAYSATDWHEVGHFLREGAPPLQALESRLKKLK